MVLLGIEVYLAIQNHFIQIDLIPGEFLPVIGK